MSKRARAPSQRQLRVGEEIRHALSGVFERGELRDPELAGFSITVSEVRVSPDLKHATVFVSPLGGNKPEILLKPLARAVPYLRRRVAAAVRLRNVPKLQFAADNSYENARQMEELLAHIRPDQVAKADEDEVLE